MKCTDKFFYLFTFICLTIFLVTGCAATPDYAKDYEKERYSEEIYKEDFISHNIAFSKEDTNLTTSLDHMEAINAAALFDVDQAKTLYSYGIFKKINPASTTKILTALVALENGNLDDVVTVSDDAGCDNFSWEEQTCGIYGGDQLTLRDLLYGLLLYSGNDNAVAIADHIGGSQKEFANMMNAEAKRLLATETHFVNPNGLQNKKHYTTAYDLYLIFNECIKYPEFIDIISADEYTAQITDSEGNVRSITWNPTNWYAAGLVDTPSNAKVIGGKTGTTDEAGNCLILLNETDDAHQYISIIMGAETKDLLYEDMTKLIDAIADVDLSIDITEVDLLSSHSDEKSEEEKATDNEDEKTSDDQSEDTPDDKPEKTSDNKTKKADGNKADEASSGDF